MDIRTSSRRRYWSYAHIPKQDYGQYSKHLIDNDVPHGPDETFENIAGDFLTAGICSLEERDAIVRKEKQAEDKLDPEGRS